MTSSKKSILSLLLLCATLLLTGCIGRLFSPSEPSQDRISATDFDQQVVHAPGLVIVDFYAEWCGPCKQLGPILEEIARERPDVHVVRVNVDDNPGLTHKFGVQGIPHLEFFRGGQIAAQSTTGLQSKEAILQHIGPPQVAANPQILK